MQNNLIFTVSFENIAATFTFFKEACFCLGGAQLGHLLYYLDFEAGLCFNDIVAED
jgi:hypothetical protein